MIVGVGVAVFVAVGVMFKQQAAMYAVAFGLAIILETLITPRNRKIASLPAAVGLYILGGVAVTAPVLAFFAWRGGLDAMTSALNPSHYVGYASTEGWGFLNLAIRESLLPMLFNTRSLLLLAFLGLWSWSRKSQEEQDRPRGPFLLPAYAAATMFAVFAGTKFFDHYYMLLIPMLALLAGRFISAAAHARSVPLALRTALVVLVIPAGLNDMRLEIDVGREAVADIARTGRAQWTEESRFYWTKAIVPRYAALSDRAKKIGECISEHSERGDTIYVWDYIPHVYFYSGLRAPTRHFMYFDVAVDLPRGSGRWHAKEDERVIAARRELLADMERSRPVNVVFFSERRSDIPWLHLTDHAPLFPELAAYVDSNYAPDPSCRDQYFVVLRRTDRM